MDTHATVSRAVELSDPAFAATQALAHSSDLGVLCFDADLIIRSVQGSIFSPLGWSHEILVEQSLPEALRASELATFRSCCEGALRGERGTLHIDGIDGSAQLRVSVGPVRVHDATIVGGIAIADRATPTRDAPEVMLHTTHSDRGDVVYA